jgi:hypothetical protein
MDLLLEPNFYVIVSAVFARNVTTIKIILLFLGSLAFFFGWITDTHAAKFYISPQGNDLNSGTSPLKAWKTIDKVNDTMFFPGDHILFQGGKDFTGSLFFDSSVAGTSTQPITISSYGIGRANIRPGLDNGFLAYNAAGYSLKNINFIGAGRTINTSDGILFYNDLPKNRKLNYVRIEGVDVSGFGLWGIALGGGRGKSGFRDVRITKTTVHDNSDGILFWGVFSTNSTMYANQNVYIGHTKVYNNHGIPGLPYNTGNGILVSDTNGGIIERCVAHHNGRFNTAVGGPVGIWAWDSNKITIQFNESYSNRTASSADGGGFDLDGGLTNSIMQYNYSHDNDGAGFLLAQFDDARPFYGNTVRYNISQNDGRKNGYGGITVWNGGSGIKNSRIYNNTVYMSPPTSGSPAAISILSPTQDVHVRNNIFITKGGLKLASVASGQKGILFQGNNYWSSGGSFAIKWGPNTYTSLSSWRNSTGQEKIGGVNSGFNVDPRLTNPGGGGTFGDATRISTLTAYRLQSSSPLIDAGLHLRNRFGINPGWTDFYGHIIPQGPAYDLGAHDTK